MVSLHGGSTSVSNNVNGPSTSPARSSLSTPVRPHIITHLILELIYPITVLCWSADAQHLAAYTHYDFYENTLLEVTLQITVAWGWLMFAINTILTGAIITRIWLVIFRLNVCDVTDGNPSVSLRAATAP